MATSLDIARGNPNAPTPVPGRLMESKSVSPSLIGLTRVQLSEALANFGISDKQVRMRASQI